MKALIFNGAMEKQNNATSVRIGNYLTDLLTTKGINTQFFNLAEAAIPLFDTSIKQTPRSVELMNLTFRDADIHIWLTPLYHGGMTGAMKNCLDWLECSAKLPIPYLTNKVIGLICWADGVQAMQGINAMDAVAKALRAWTSPYNIPIKRSDLFDAQNQITEEYQQRMELLSQVLINGPKPTIQQNI